jgi:hypothetical protein
MILNFIKKIRYYLLVTISLIVIYFSIKYAVVYFVASQLQALLDQQDTPKITWQNVQFEPFNKRLTIKDIKIDQHTSLQNFVIDLALPNLFKKEIHIEEININGLEGKVVSLADELRIANVILPKKEKTQKVKKTNKWRLVIAKINIANMQVNLPEKQQIQIKKAYVSNVNFIQPQQLMNLDILLKNKQGSFKLAGKMAMDFEKPNIQLAFAIDKFDLDIFNVLPLKKLFNFLQIQGKLTSKGKIEVQDSQRQISLNLALENFYLYVNNLQTIDYFSRKVVLEEFKLSDNAQNLTVHSDLLKVKNLIFSESNNSLKVKELSDFAEFKMSNINFKQDKVKMQTMANVELAQGGSLRLNYNKQELYLKITNFELSQFSETFVSLLNYHIASGKLNLEAVTKRQGSEIQGNVRVNLAQLNLDSENEFGEDLAQQSSIPLKTALAIIEDDKGNIRLDFKISGSTDDPKFNFFNMLSQGLGQLLINQLSSAVASQMAVRFVPLLVQSVPFSPSNSFAFVNGAYKFITKPRFEDIEFLLLRSKIAKKSVTDINNISKFLKENPAIKLHICPTASIFEKKKPAAKTITPKKALQLASDRIAVLDNLFQKELGDDLGQIIFCRPKISDKKHNLSRAEVSL